MKRGLRELTCKRPERKKETEKKKKENPQLQIIEKGGERKGEF